MLPIIHFPCDRLIDIEREIKRASAAAGCAKIGSVIIIYISVTFPHSFLYINNILGSAEKYIWRIVWISRESSLSSLYGLFAHVIFFRRYGFNFPQLSTPNMLIFVILGVHVCAILQGLLHYIGNKVWIGSIVVSHLSHSGWLKQFIPFSCSIILCMPPLRGSLLIAATRLILQNFTIILQQYHRVLN